MDDGQPVGRALSPATVIDLENDFLKPYTTIMSRRRSRGNIITCKRMQVKIAVLTPMQYMLEDMSYTYVTEQTGL